MSDYSDPFSSPDLGTKVESTRSNVGNLHIYYHVIKSLTMLNNIKKYGGNRPVSKCLISF